MEKIFEIDKVFDSNRKKIIHFYYGSERVWLNEIKGLLLDVLNEKDKGYIIGYTSKQEFDEINNLKNELRIAKEKLKEYMAFAEKDGDINDGR